MSVPPVGFEDPARDSVPKHSSIHTWLEFRGRKVGKYVIPRNKNPDQIFIIIIYAYFYAYILASIHLRMIRPLYTYFETQTISYPDSASCVGIMTEPATLFSDHHQSGLSRVVCIGRNAVIYPYVHVCTLFRSTRLSRL